MGRHKRTASDRPGRPVGPSTPAAGAPATAPAGRDARRTAAPRSGLLGASAAMAVGAVAMASGLIPGTGGPGGYTYGGTDQGGYLARPDELPATAAPVYASPLPAHTAAPAGPAAGGGGRPAAGRGAPTLAQAPVAPSPVPAASLPPATPASAAAQTAQSVATGTPGTAAHTAAATAPAPSDSPAAPSTAPVGASSTAPVGASSTGAEPTAPAGGTGSPTCPDIPPTAQNGIGQNGIGQNAVGPSETAPSAAEARAAGSGALWCPLSAGAYAGAGSPRPVQDPAG